MIALHILGQRLVASSSLCIGTMIASSRSAEITDLPPKIGRFELMRVFNAQCLLDVTIRRHRVSNCCMIVADTCYNIL